MDYSKTVDNNANGQQGIDNICQRIQVCGSVASLLSCRTSWNPSGMRKYLDLVTVPLLPLQAAGNWHLADYLARLWRVAFIICRIFSDDLCICLVTDLCHILIQLDISTCCQTLISSSAYDFQSKHNQKVAWNFNLLIVLPCLGICVYFQFELLNPKANSLNLFCGKEQ